ncbi:unnamed protein product [Effrenium voratum]|nr:unnamed protein product [Effrenium voratum]|mmetsp:Transcript_97768/g.232811  ORF Transcript_97768/g.232811 Transcript_97768/m.232811 type:complete len:144 (-) Transcript_97768:106-537(-)
MPPSGGGKRGGKGSKGEPRQEQAEKQGKRSGGRTPDKDNQSVQSAGESNGEALPPKTLSDEAQRFDANAASAFISKRFQDVMEEYKNQKQTGKKDVQNFSDLNSGGAWGGGAKPVLPGKEDFLQQLQTALLHFQRARQMEDGS